MKKHEEHEKDNSERWLLTYSDLITLLMIFFVIMYAISNVDAQKYQVLSQSLEGALNPMGFVGAGSGGNASGSGIDVMDAIAAGQDQADPELVAAAEQIKKLIKEKNLQDRVSVSVQERGVVVGLMNTVFRSGSTQIKPDAVPPWLQSVRSPTAYITISCVEGNTDDVPMNTPQIPSNWELSVLRATEVLKLLINQSNVAPDRISAVGYGEFRPSVPNTSAENRAKNRKVDLVILSDSLESSESENADKGEDIQSE
jgi:chemotaxis protein MotB